MTGITPPHPGACAELWKTEASLQPLVLKGDEPVIKIYVMRAKNAVAHELHERLSNFCEDRRITNSDPSRIFFALELGEKKQDIERQPAHGRGIADRRVACWEIPRRLCECRQPYVHGTIF